MKIIIIILIMLHASLFTLSEARAQIINIPADYPTIQEGINAATNGDIVLVQPGTYVEGINFNGKNITVASLFFTTQDTSYISQTVIDGDSSSTVVSIGNGVDSTAVLCGFTVTRGDGGYKGGGISIGNSSPLLNNLKIIGNTAWNGGGIAMENSSPTIQDVYICNNSAFNDHTGGSCCPDASGGGIHCIESNPVLLNVKISNNAVISLRGSTAGGGIYCFWSNPVLQNVTLSDNIAERNSGNWSGGGGIYCRDSTLYLSDVAITGNSAKYGGGILGNSNIIFDSINRSNIYLNQASFGNDLYYKTYIEVYVDTFTVISPTEFHASPPENFSFNILNGLIEQEEADLYVSPIGDNTNNGLTAGDPLKTIWYAYLKMLADSLHPHTIHLLNGVYSPSAIEEVYPVNMLDYISLSGESENDVFLDAEGVSQVLFLDSKNGIQVSDLAITGGSGFYHEGGGIHCGNSNPTFLNITILNNNAFEGGGIYCLDASPFLNNVTIFSNTANYGGGLYLWESSPVFQGVTIDSNSARIGGGIYCSEMSSPLMESVTISNNNASDKGGGIFCEESSLVFDSINRCNIFLNKAIWGNDLYTDSSLHVIVDTFTVLHPTEFHASPFKKFTFDILHGKIEQVDADLYVSPDGDNENSGLTTDDPLKTIRYGFSKMMADSLHHNTIHLLEGTYSSSTNGELYPLNIPDYISLNGVLEDSVILDAGEQAGVMLIHNNDTTSIAGMTLTGGYTYQGGGIYCNNSSLRLQDITISNNAAYPGYGGGAFCINANLLFQSVTISENSAQRGNGGGIWCSGSGNMKFQDVTISDNHSENGGGIYFYNSSARLQNVTISQNRASGTNECYGGGIYCIDSSPELINATISGNSSWDGGGAIYCNGASTLLVTNSILWDNLPDEIFAYPVDITYCDIQGGWSGEGNIDTDPLFSGSVEHPFALSDGSPCIDVGTPDTTGLNLPPWDIIGNMRVWDGDGNGIAVIDMGAYEYGSIPVGIDRLQVAGCGLQLMVYPNPAGRMMNIEYRITNEEVVSLSVVDIYGREVDRLVSETQPAGEYTVRLDASDLPAGLYLVCLHAGKESATGKILVVH